MWTDLFKEIQQDDAAFCSISYTDVDFMYRDNHESVMLYSMRFILFMIQNYM